MKIIILAGGRGTRLWPLSRDSYPKQFLQLGDEKSLLQKTILRFSSVCSAEDILIVTNQAYYHLVKNQCYQLDPNVSYKIILEPESKNTAPAIGLSIKYFQEKCKVSEDEVVLVCSSDHIIHPENAFISLLGTAENAARDGNIITFGVHPTFPETGYGYIKYIKDNSSVCDVERFVEKPNKDLAVQFILDGNYLWNSGIFAFSIKTFWQELQIHSIDLFNDFENPWELCIAQFSEMQEISIDYAIMEKSNLVKVIPMHLSWSDVGSWDSVYEAFKKDDHSNVKLGNVVDVDTKNCLIFGNKRLVTTVGIEDLIIVETTDAILIAKKGHSQKVKSLVNQLMLKKIAESTHHQTVFRPWGSYTVLEEGIGYKIKKILVYPGQRLSLQYHHHRSEHWVVVKGQALVTLGQNEIIVNKNESVFVEKKQLHRMQNSSDIDLEIIEVQVGEYLEEDDIVRIQDDYARV